MVKQRTYTGYSGQRAVMAELLFRQCNVTVPDIDLGAEFKTANRLLLLQLLV